MTYYSEDVQLVLPRTGGIGVSLWRRNRKGFRARLVALGGRETHGGDIVGIPIDKLDEVKQVIAEEYPAWQVEVRDERAVQKRPGDRVRWADEAGYYGRTNHNGYVGQVRLFSVSKIYRDDKMHLRTELPGFEQSQHEGVRKAETRDEAERLAEEVLAEFLERIGATWRES